MASPQRLLLVGNTQVILCEPKRKAYGLGLGEKSSLALSLQLLTWKPVAPIATDWQPTFILRRETAIMGPQGNQLKTREK